MWASHGGKKCSSLFKVQMNLNLTSKERLMMLISCVLLFELISFRDKKMLLWKLSEFYTTLKTDSFGGMARWL